jgi:hypothetical protein
VVASACALRFAIGVGELLQAMQILRRITKQPWKHLWVWNSFKLAR